MLKTFIMALFLGVVVLIAWQSDGSGIAQAEVHSGNLHNCDFFSDQAAAQAHLEENPSDPDRLDADDDGIACEHLRDCPCDPVAANAGATDTGDLYNCDDFSTQASAQARWRQDTSDPDNLDADNDNIACERLLPCPCDPASANDADQDSGGGSSGNPAIAGGGLCHEQCRPSLVPQCGSLRDDDFLYTECADGLNHSPGLNRPAAMTFLTPNTTVSCGGQATLVARVVYPDGVGAPNRLFTFRSSLGTVRGNLLSDFAGYVQTSFVAPASPGIVQIDAIADGLRQSLQVKVECAQPVVPAGFTAPPPAAPAVTPPRTGEAGLASNDAIP